MVTSSVRLSSIQKEELFQSIDKECKEYRKIKVQVIGVDHQPSTCQFANMHDFILNNNKLVGDKNFGRKGNSTIKFLDTILSESLIVENFSAIM